MKRWKAGVGLRDAEIDGKSETKEGGRETRKRQSLQRKLFSLSFEREAFTVCLLLCITSIYHSWN